MQAKNYLDHAQRQRKLEETICYFQFCELHFAPLPRSCTKTMRTGSVVGQEIVGNAEKLASLPGSCTKTKQEIVGNVEKLVCNPGVALQKRWPTYQNPLHTKGQEANKFSCHFKKQQKGNNSIVHSWSCTLDPHIKSQNTKKEKKRLLKEIVDKSRWRKQLHCNFLESHKYLECRASGWRSNANISELSQEQLSLQNYWHWRDLLEATIISSPC